MENEVWKDVVGYEGLYEVSNLGNVKSYYKDKNGKILKPYTIGKKPKHYLAVSFYENKLRKHKNIHQLVAEAFLGHKRCGFKLVVDHINDNALDNRVQNLQIVTQRFNTKKTQTKYSSNYKGVFIKKEKYLLKSGEFKIYKMIQSKIKINKKYIHLGTFKTEEEAHLAYQNAILKYSL